MKKQSFFITLLLMMTLICLHTQIFSQSKLRVSVLTCAAGEETYSIWGHTAVRIYDSANQTDVVYNFGTFDFEEPNFIPKFVKGSLLYFISATSFQQFIYEYQYFKRDIDEQVLNLKDIEKIKWQKALSENMIGNNRYYLYNFIYDNCTTRIKDGLYNNSGCTPKDIAIKSYRPFIVEACYNTDNAWTGLGIDLLLGSESDKAPSTLQQGFLPPLLFTSIAAIPNLVSETKHYSLSNSLPKTMNRNNIFYTLLLFLFVYLFISNWNTLLMNRLGKIMDITLLILLGLGGSLIVYMSEFSLHSACHENYNLIWLHPLYLILVPFYFIHHKALKYASIAFIIMTCLFMLISYFIPQSFSKEIIVIMAITLWVQIRMIHRSKLLALNK